MTEQRFEQFVDFASVLDLIELQAYETAPDWRPDRMRFPSNAILSALSSILPPAEACSAQDAAFLEGFDIAPEQPAYTHMLQTDPKAIADEIGLTKAAARHLDRGKLQQMRRSFAARNHPDLLPPHYREQAEQRMKIANMLIDDAITQHDSI